MLKHVWLTNDSAKSGALKRQKTHTEAKQSLQLLMTGQKLKQPQVDQLVQSLIVIEAEQEIKSHLQFGDFIASISKERQEKMLKGYFDSMSNKEYDVILKAFNK